MHLSSLFFRTEVRSTSASMSSLNSTFRLIRTHWKVLARNSALLWQENGSVRMRKYTKFSRRCYCVCLLWCLCHRRWRQCLWSVGHSTTTTQNVTVQSRRQCMNGSTLFTACWLSRASRGKRKCRKCRAVKKYLSKVEIVNFAGHSLIRPFG